MFEKWTIRSTYSCICESTGGARAPASTPASATIASYDDKNNLCLKVVIVAKEIKKASNCKERLVEVKSNEEEWTGIYRLGTRSVEEVRLGTQCHFYLNNVDKLAYT